LDDAFEQKNEIAKAVEEELEKVYFICYKKYFIDKVITVDLCKLE
jgi:hypothetical protein